MSDVRTSNLKVNLKWKLQQLIELGSATCNVNGFRARGSKAHGFKPEARRAYRFWPSSFQKKGFGVGGAKSYWI
jgi:hypothetical protein